MTSLPPVRRKLARTVPSPRPVPPTRLELALAVTDAYARLPIVGKYLEPLGTLTAVGAFAARIIPSVVSEVMRSNPLSDLSIRRTDPAPDPIQSAIGAAVRQFDPTDRDATAPLDRRPPMLRAAEHRRAYLYRSDVRYGSAPGQVLDVWRRPDLPPGPAPVMVFVPGGGWIHGSRMMQGYALMAHLAERGWLCLSVNYRVAPRHPWPRHIRDVKAAVAWARANVDTVGGDRDFVAISGCSAGGHLAALTGLTADDAKFATELEPGADTSVDAVVGLYGRYDWLDRSTRERDEFVNFLERIVVRKPFSKHAELFRDASPIARVRADAPPFLVVHGDADGVIPVAQARDFVDRLGATSRSAVGYLEVPGAGHAFDLTDGERTQRAVFVVRRFLDEVLHAHRADARKAM